MKKKREEGASNAGIDGFHSTSQPIPVPGHRRTKSSLEMTKSFSPNYATPDMVADTELAAGSNVCSKNVIK